MNKTYTQLQSIIMNDNARNVEDIEIQKLRAMNEEENKKNALMNSSYE